MKYQHRVMGMLSLLAVITYVDRVCIGVAGPRMQDELGISPEAWGWVASVTVIGRWIPAEKRARGHGGMPWRHALADATFWRVALIGASYVYTLSFFQSWLQTYLDRGRGYTEAALVLSSLPCVVGAVANGCGGLLSDALVRRRGLPAGRRTVGVLGLSCAALFMFATIVASSNLWALVILSLSYAGIMLQQPNLCAVCLDTGRTHARAMLGFMNTAWQIASVVSSLAFGYIVGYTGNYNLPFIPMVVTLSIGAVLWLTMDPTHQMFEHKESLAA